MVISSFVMSALTFFSISSKMVVIKVKGERWFMKKILVIDGKGGRLGGAIVEMLKKEFENFDIYAIGTNAIATSQMAKQGASFVATGENAVVVNAKDADVLIGPIGVAIANSFLGEVTGKMAKAVGKSNAFKIFVPSNRCNHFIVGTVDLTINDSINAIKAKLKDIENCKCE